MLVEQKYVKNHCNENLLVETYTPDHYTQTIMFCHGITGCRKGRTPEDNYLQELAKALMNMNFKVILFDFSGHGDSEGNDYDVSLSKSTLELKKVFEEEKVDADNVSFLAFSYGAAVLCNFLETRKDIMPKHMVFYSPCLFPLDSCFLNANSLFGKDIVSGYKDGILQKNGYAVVGAKGFRFGNQMIEDCKNFSPEYLVKFSDRLLIMHGQKDVILNIKFNEDFCKKNNIKNLYFEASHSLFEDIESVFKETIAWFSK